MTILILSMVKFDIRQYKPPRLTSLYHIWERKYRAICTVGKGILLVYLYKEKHSFSLNQSISCTFDGSIFRTYFNGALVDNQPATVGDCMYIIPHGEKKAPNVEKAKLPESRGARIAWALSFIGTVKYAESLEEFFEKYQSILADPNVRNHMYELKSGCFAFLIADKVVESNKAKAAPKLKQSCPLLAWIADDISNEDLSDLCTRFSKYRSIYCPLEYLNLP